MSSRISLCHRGFLASPSSSCRHPGTHALQLYTPHLHARVLHQVTNLHIAIPSHVCIHAPLTLQSWLPRLHAHVLHETPTSTLPHHPIVTIHAPMPYNHVPLTCMPKSSTNSRNSALRATKSVSQFTWQGGMIGNRKSKLARWHVLRQCALLRRSRTPQPYPR